MHYVAPRTIGEAVERAGTASGIVRFLAGGTDVLVQLRSGLVEPDLVVDIKRIPGMRDITADNGGWRIGAAVSGAELESHSGVSKDWPGVVEALELIGSTQIQGRATLVGNLCNASPAADSVPAMIAAGASVSIAGPNGARDVPVADIPTGPGQTSLEGGEIITSVLLPERGSGGGDAYLRFIPRTEMDIAVVGCGVNVRVAGEKVVEARVVLGAVAPTAVVVEDAADAILGTSLDDDALDGLATACSAACRPIDDKRGTIKFRTRVAGVLGKRAATIAFDRARRSR
ncbi:MAG: xanthine dehydrogenase family protein subunit M [Rhodobacteraceae bacterium]|nr:xanthine dehydrogenase family protein subunit M [Paracoccaceae bacterium]